MRTFLIALVAALSAAAQPIPAGPYLGQPAPGAVPELFAPGIVNTGLYTRDMAISPDGRELYFSVFLGAFAHAAIVTSRQVAGRWTDPEVAPFATDPRWRYLEPCISPDGQAMFFASDRPEDAAATQPGPFGIWQRDRTALGWSEPRRLGPPVNGAQPCFFPSVTLEGTLYFSREEGPRQTAIWRARKGPKGYLAPERLPSQVNGGKDRYNAFVAPDERLLILGMTGRSDSLGGTDHYVVFRDDQDRWSEPINLGPAVNSPGNDEYSAALSPDGKFLFFMSGRPREHRFPAGEGMTLRKLQRLAAEPGANGNAAIYWMRADFLDVLRKGAVFTAKP